MKYAEEFDGVTLTSESIRVTGAEIIAAREEVDHSFMASAREAHKRIVTFARTGLKKDWNISSAKGGTIGEQFTPIERVGVYIPGGSAPLVSTCLMTATLAKVAGTLEIVACTPCEKDGKINPHLLFALDLAGVTEIYKLGGIQAIGAMAFGTESVKKFAR